NVTGVQTCALPICELGPQAVAGRAGTKRGVEGEGARLELVELQCVAIRAGHLLGEAALTVRIVLVQAHEFDDDDTVRAAQCRLDGGGAALLLVFLHLEAVEDRRSPRLNSSHDSISYA